MPHTNIKKLIKSRFFYKFDDYFWVLKGGRENLPPYLVKMMGWYVEHNVLICINIKRHLLEENVNVKNYCNTLA